MENKKSESANIEKNRNMYLQIGIVLVLSLVLVAFEWSSKTKTGNEALRVVNSSPRWTPGKQSGKPVKVIFTFPINFVLK